MTDRVPVRASRRALLVGSGLGLAAMALTSLRGRASAASPGQFAVTATARQLVAPPDPHLGNMTPTGDAASVGMFGPQLDWPLIPIHATLLPNGHLVTYGTPLGRAEQNGLVYDDWSPADGTAAAAHAQTPSMETYNSFCNGLQVMADGRLIMIGGNSAVATMTFDPSTGQETMGAQLKAQRWYATILRRPDDRILVLGGGEYYNTEAYRNPTDNSRVATTPEIGTGIGSWSLLDGAQSSTAFGATRNRWWYPRAYNAPDGRVFGMSDDQMWMLSDTGAGAVSDMGRLPITPGVSGSSVMYTSGRILVAGGGQAMNTQTVTASGAACVVDITGSRPQATATSSMALARNWVNLTVLANGEVLANGGTINGTEGGADNSAYQVEVWNPKAGTWRGGARAQRIRTYHSTALLMQSGAVFTGGGGVPGPEDNLNAEMYYPPYLFTRGADRVTRWADRPQLTSIAGSATYGGKLTVGLSDARRITRVHLTRLGNVTHSVNADQRLVPVSFWQSGASLAIALPTSKHVLPPGSYALTAVDAAGVPSPSQTLTLFRDGSAGTVTVYPPATTTGGPAGFGTQAGSVPLTVGTVVGLTPGNYPGHRVRHAEVLLGIEAASTESPPLTRGDCSYIVRAGLAGQGVSFEPVNRPGWFLGAATGQRASLVRHDASVEVAAAATFLPMAGLAGQGTSLQLFSDASAYLRHRDFQVVADRFDQTGMARADSTFRVTAPLDPLMRNARISLEPVGSPGSLLRHQDFVARVGQIGVGSDATSRADATFTVRSAVTGGVGVSLESVNYPGQYLRQLDERLVLGSLDGTASATAATFQPVTGMGGSGVTLRSAHDGPVVVSAFGATIAVGAPASTEAARIAASFVVRPPVG